DSISKMTVPQIGPEELAQVLKSTITARLPLLITGMPGIGKTEITKQICEKLKIRYIIFHPVISDPTDFKGMPWVVSEGGKFHGYFIPFAELQLMTETEEPLVVVFDDLGQAPSMVQAAIMQFLLERKLNMTAIKDGVTFVAATNRKKDKAAVTGILEPVKSRFATIVELVADQKAWRKWAMQAGLSKILIAFIDFRPELLCAFKPTSDFTNSPVPRTIENLDKLIKLDLPVQCRAAAYAGAVGMGFTREYLAFEQMYRDLKQINIIPENPESVPVPTKPDVKYAIVNALVNLTEKDNIVNIMAWIGKLPIEFQALYVSDIETMKNKLVETRPIIDWKIEHGSLRI
ncbi:MAG: ATP-binding protein, partial [bacterium]